MIKLPRKEIMHNVGDEYKQLSKDKDAEENEKAVCMKANHQAISPATISMKRISLQAQPIQLVKNRPGDRKMRLPVPYIPRLDFCILVL